MLDLLLPSGPSWGLLGCSQAIVWCRGGHCGLSFLGLTPLWRELPQLPPALVE